MFLEIGFEKSDVSQRARSPSFFSHVEKILVYWCLLEKLLVYWYLLNSKHRSLLAFDIFDPVAWHGSQPTKFEKSLSASLRPVPRSACRAEHMDANETFWAAWLSGIQSWPVGPSNFENPQLGLAMDAITPLWDNDVKMTPEFPQMLVTGMWWNVLRCWHIHLAQSSMGKSLPSVKHH